MDDFDRTAEMLKSVEPALDLETTRGRATVLRALLGSVDPDEAMLAICACGWRGILLDTRMEEYNSAPASWHRLAGRSGWHYLCPTCGAVVWKHYTLIN